MLRAPCLRQSIPILVSELSILTTSHEAVRARSAPAAAWQKELRGAIRDPLKLCQALNLPRELLRTATAAAPGADFPLFVPASFLRRIEPANPRDPLLLQVWPAAAEADPAEGFTADPTADGTFALAPGLLKKYAGRALMILTGACAVHCRYCFRRHFPYEDTPPSETVWNDALAAIQLDSSIHEVILSGGDPLTVTDARLARLVGRIAAIPHVQRLRVHSRLPVMIPSRVTGDLLDWLAGTRLAPVMVIHANHAQELDAEVAAALQRLRTAGAMLLNQAVLLRGVNDSVEAQAALSLRLLDLGVRPYYLHQLDRVRGAAHFETPVSEGRAIMAELRRRLPGYAVPQYVQEQPGAPHKVVLG
ncbi:MAG: EF-P beta-lysylation protein EpmB [Pirellulales bacterium]|nr:EF-P beta-lysylation protein EpmB [Pirellulales bacterium]